MSRNLQLQRLASLLSILIVLTFSNSGHTEALQRVSVQLLWKHQFEFAAFYAAQDQGYYRQAGLNVDIKEGGPGIDAVKEVYDGKADFGVGTSTLVIARK